MEERRFTKLIHQSRVPRVWHQSTVQVSNIKTTLGAFDAQLTKFATDLSGAIAELNATVEDLSEMMGRNKS